jgi:hypothetical protein
MIAYRALTFKAALHRIREAHMIKTRIANWWLLALCGVLYAILAMVNVFMRGPDGFPALRTGLPASTAMPMFGLQLAIGVGAVAAGIWGSGDGRSSWLLALNGLACSAYALIPILFWTRPLSFRLFALLLVVMAISMGVFALAAARTPRRHVPDKWFLGLAGAASVGFALAFLVLGLGWIKLAHRPLSSTLWLWFGSYFGFSAICMLGLALCLHSQGLSQSGPGEALPPLGSPKHAQ